MEDMCFSFDKTLLHHTVGGENHLVMASHVWRTCVFLFLVWLSLVSLYRLHGWVVMVHVTVCLDVCVYVCVFCVERVSVGVSVYVCR